MPYQGRWGLSVAPDPRAGRALHAAPPPPPVARATISRVGRSRARANSVGLDRRADPAQGTVGNGLPGSLGDSVRAFGPAAPAPEHCGPAVIVA